MSDPTGIAFVGDHGRESLGKAKPPLRLRQQHDAAIRAEASAIKGGSDFLAIYRWKRERQQIIVGGGGRGTLQICRKDRLYQPNSTPDQKLTLHPPAQIRRPHE